MKRTVWDILSSNAQDRAIGAPDRAWLSGPALAGLAVEARSTLNRAGIGRGERVAIVLPNGPEMAACFMAVAACCTAAPLNPGYKSDEFEFYLSDLKPAALILADGDESPARIVAARLGIPVIGLQHGQDAAGLFRLDASAVPNAAAALPGPAEPDDIALVLHTSGTTARPKIVLLSNRNLAASARHIGETLSLAPADCCLNIMPLFHIHGLIAADLVVRSGAGAVGVAARRASMRCKLLRLARGSEAADLVHGRADDASGDPRCRLRSHVRRRRKAAKLRFIRSSSASLPPQVMAELEAAFAIVRSIEAYGMTEASASDGVAMRCRPGKRKPGAVGLRGRSADRHHGRRCGQHAAARRRSARS